MTQVRRVKRSRHRPANRCRLPRSNMEITPRMQQQSCLWLRLKRSFKRRQEEVEGWVIERSRLSCFCIWWRGLLDFSPVGVWKEPPGRPRTSRREHLFYFSLKPGRRSAAGRSETMETESFMFSFVSWELTLNLSIFRFIQAEMKKKTSSI